MMEDARFTPVELAAIRRVTELMMGEKKLEYARVSQINAEAEIKGRNAYEALLTPADFARVTRGRTRDLLERGR